MLLLRQHTSKSHAARDRYCIICRQFAPHFSQAVENLWGTWYQYCSTDRVLESPYLLLRRFYDFHRMSYWELTTKRSRLPSPRCRAAPHLCPRVSWSPRAGPRSCWEWPPAPGGSWQTVRLASLSCTPSGFIFSLCGWRQNISHFYIKFSLEKYKWAFIQDYEDYGKSFRLNFYER